MLKIKPQWYYREVNGIPTLSSENWHQAFPIEQTALVEKLVAGVDPEELSDEEFASVEYLSNSGFLARIVEPDAPAWELTGLNYHSVKEQLSHTTVRIIDLTPNGVGARISVELEASGVRVLEETAGKARITLVFANAYTDIANPPAGTWMPVIVNRVRLNLGPIQFPWSASIVESVQENPRYMRTVGYKLPVVFSKLQEPVITMMLVQFLAHPKLKFVGNVVEFNLGKQREVLWPI